MMDILIIEDEETAYESLKGLLLDIDPSINIIGRLQSVEQSISWFKTNSFPDLILLDIQLSDDLSFKIFESVEVNCPVIFTTAFDEYAIKAFELNSIDYLLKPITKQSLEKSIFKFQSRVQSISQPYEKLIQDLRSLTNTPSYKERFLVNKADELLIVQASEIAYFFKDDVTYVRLESGKQYPIKYTLEQLEGLLNPTQFYRVNRQLVVSVKSIDKVAIWFKGKLKLQLTPPFQESVMVSKEKANSFKLWLDN